MGMLSKEDLKQISDRGITEETIVKQIGHFISGFPYVTLVKPAAPGDGMLVFPPDRQQKYISHFEEKLPVLKAVKFVPASGAASRMFKNLFEFREKLKAGADFDKMISSDPGFNSVQHLIKCIHQFAFFDDLIKVMAADSVIPFRMNARDACESIIHYILDPEGLNYANLPKALLKFHLYPGGARTAAEEHLVEAAAYTKDRHLNARIHFTISPEHLGKFRDLLKEVTESYESALDVKFDISFSKQNPSTDTLAVDTDNRPFRNSDGSLLFRPGGHGALLENLNEIDADLIFIKNIDNIVPDRLKEETIRYKKILGGYLVSLKATIDRYLRRIEEDSASGMELQEMRQFAKDSLFIDIPDDLSMAAPTVQRQTLFSLLNRPLRVCGMVKNEGEPGGGPFWVKDPRNSVSLQIVESSQINPADPAQKEILASATHFNPVDLVCSTRDFRGNTFNLKEFVDENTGFISLKSSGGRALKAQELPGLWNGAMAGWITIFVEVPVITFNPVKTVNDLLRSEHLA